jgi:organic radical activating enzyme
MNIFDIQLGFGSEVPNKISLNIYFSGCTDNKKCDREFCHNKHIHDFTNGYDYTLFIPHIKTLLDKQMFIDCICFLGGEPFDQNILKLIEFTNILRTLKKGIDIYAYTGYDYPEQKKLIDSITETLNLKNVYAGHFSVSYKNQKWVKNSN